MSRLANSLVSDFNFSKEAADHAEIAVKEKINKNKQGFIAYLRLFNVKDIDSLEKINEVFEEFKKYYIGNFKAKEKFGEYMEINFPEITEDINSESYSALADKLKMCGRIDFEGNHYFFPRP